MLVFVSYLMFVYLFLLYSSNRCFVSLISETSETAMSLSSNTHQGRSPAGVIVSLSPMVLKWHCSFALYLSTKITLWNSCHVLLCDWEEQQVRFVCPQPFMYRRFWQCGPLLMMVMRSKDTAPIIQFTLSCLKNNTF